MRSSLMRTAIVTSLVTAMVVTGAAMYLAPRFMNTASTNAVEPAVYQGANSNDPQPAATVTDNTPQLRRRAALPKPSAIQTARPAAPVYSPAAERDTYGEPVAHHHRSTRNSVLIVAGSAGTGAAIGALAGGGKGAGIGALAGGVGGFVYDRLTANK